MENSAAITLFFVFIFVGILFFVLGLVLLFRPGVQSGSQTVKARVVDVQPRAYDYVVTIRYEVNGKQYTYVFATSASNKYVDGQYVWFNYNPKNPAEPAGKKVNTVAHVFGIIFVILSMVCVLVGTIWSYSMMDAPKNASTFSLFGSKK